MSRLYLISTPIGNLEDITLRALRVLKEVDLVLCEDTRRTRKLLTHYGIEKPLESLFEHNESSKTALAVKLLKSGKNMALVTDSGTPLVSDPGYRLVRAAVKNGLIVMPVPGPSALLTALAVSGLATDRFLFVGFFPQKEAKRNNFLKSLLGEEATIVAFESPQRLFFTLKSIKEIFGDVQMCVAREMTKIHEEFFRGSVSEAVEHFELRPVKGEITLVIAPKIGDGLS